MSPKELISVGAAALMVHQNFPQTRCGVDYESKDPTFRNELLLRYGPHAKRFFDDLAAAGGFEQSEIAKGFARQEVRAVIIATYMWPTTAEHAKRFWVGTARNDGLLIGDPRKTFLNVLAQAGQKKGRSEALYLARAAAAAWNAFYRGEPLKKFNIARAPGPVVLNGTPHDGKGARGMGAMPMPSTAAVAIEAIL